MEENLKKTLKFKVNGDNNTVLVFFKHLEIRRNCLCIFFLQLKKELNYRPRKNTLVFQRILLI